MTGRPRSFDRDAALATAVAMFWRVGYEQTTIAMLTRAMGVTPPSLYAAFGDKDRLFDEAAALYFARVRDAVEAAAALPSVHEAIGSMLDDTARAHTADGTPPGCLMLTEPRLGAQRAEIHRTLSARIARGVADGDLDPGTRPDQLASFLMVVMQGMSARARDGASRAEIAAAAELALAAIPRRSSAA